MSECAGSGSFLVPYMNFVVDAKRAGKGEVSVSIDKDHIPHELMAHGDGTYRVSYVSELVGNRCIDVLFNKIHVPGR